MKKIITVLLFIFMLSTTSKVYSQINVNSWMLYGLSSMWFMAGSEKINDDGTKIDGAKLLNLKFQTAAAYFIISNLALGWTLNWEYERQKYAASSGGYDEINRSNGFSTGPMVRYYPFQFGSLMLYAEGMIAFGVLCQLYKALEQTKYRDALIRAHLLLGVTYFVSRTIALDLGIGYQWLRYNSRDINYINSYHRFMACVGIVFFLGNNAGLLSFGK
jgi:hypothetical protein